jgi:hypothetical protein
MDTWGGGEVLMANRPMRDAKTLEYNHVGVPRACEDEELQTQPLSLRTRLLDLEDTLSDSSRGLDVAYQAFATGVDSSVKTQECPRVDSIEDTVARCESYARQIARTLSELRAFVGY